MTSMVPMSTALLVIDGQESFRQRPSWAEISAPDIAERIARLVAHARDRGDAVVWVLHAEPGGGGVFDPVRGFVRLLPGLDPRDGEPVLTKTSHNAFTTTNLAQWLTARGVDEVAVTQFRPVPLHLQPQTLVADDGVAAVEAHVAEPVRPTDSAADDIVRGGEHLGRPGEVEQVHVRRDGEHDGAGEGHDPVRMPQPRRTRRARPRPERPPRSRPRRTVPAARPPCVPAPRPR